MKEVVYILQKIIQKYAVMNLENFCKIINWSF